MNNYRKKQARDVRVDAADLAYNRPHPRHQANGDEQKFRSADGTQPSYLASFTKGMAHDKNTGLLHNPAVFKQFVKGIDSGDARDFIDTRLGPLSETSGKPNWLSKKAKKQTAKVRAWESQGAGLTYDLEGPDAQAVTMPPAPALGSDELTAEMGEVYAQALLRDVPFTEIVDCSGTSPCAPCNKSASVTVQTVFDELNNLDWFKSDDCGSLTTEEASRKRGQITGQNAFRGITPGDDIGPYISQFLLAGNRGLGGIHEPSEGLISYGSINIDQRVRHAVACDDHMTNWDEWLDVQDGADFRGLEQYTDKESTPYRFIATPRDLATYVHHDALYEAYLNACLILLGEGTPFDPDLPFQADDHIDHQQAFAHFGGPHILSLVTEVATRALKAVRYQKFNVHRRIRPEVLAARLTKHKELSTPELDTMATDLQPMLDMIAAINPADKNCPDGNYLLPMAFCEGSPMHPAYGAGHATVAGACVTILKAFFDHKQPLTLAGSDTKAFVADGNNASNLTTIDVVGGKLTVEGELNKLASNIAIGRDWAGVHYFTDYIESIRMGEQIALGILEEQKLTFGENFSMTVPLFDGGSIRI